MPTHRTKPEYVDAFQMTEARRRNNGDWPEWLNAAWQKATEEPGSVGPLYPEDSHTDLLAVRTLWGTRTIVQCGGWIISDADGQLDTECNEDFEFHYDKLEAL
jgi:hypothetical protein